MKWDSKHMIELIELYKKHPSLWDQSSQEYRMRRKRAEDLRHIANTLNVERCVAERKWKSLRTTYKSELNKIDASKRSDNLYVSPWLYFSYLKFLYGKGDDSNTNSLDSITAECEDSDGSEIIVYEEATSENNAETTNFHRQDIQEYNDDSSGDEFQISISSDIENTDLGEATISTEIKQKWSPKAIYQLIQQYQQHLSLWDSSVKEYRLKNIKEGALCQVAENMGLNKNVIERKWKGLRTQCKSELRKIKESRTNGSSRIYFSNWRYLKAMKFLYDNCTDIETDCKISLRECDSDDSEGIEIMLETPQDEETTESTKCENDDSMDDTTQHPKRMKPNTSKQKETVENEDEERPKDNATNECDIFCSLMATKLRKLNNNLRDQAMRQLMQVMWKFEDAQKQSSKLYASSHKDSL